MANQSDSNMDVPQLTYMTKTINGETYKIVNAEYNISPERFQSELFDMDDIADLHFDGILKLLVHHMVNKDKIQFRFIIDLTYELNKLNIRNTNVDDCFATSFESFHRDDSFKSLDDKLERLTDFVIEYESTLPDSAYKINRFRVQIKTKV